jgi:hypothetical protein
MSITTTHEITAELAAQNYSLVRASELKISPELQAALDLLLHFYETLPADEYLPNGGKYRFRRFGRFYYVPAVGEMRPLPHVDYFQSLEHNRVTGGIIRKFAPLLPQIFENEFVQGVIQFDFQQFPITEEMRHHPWQVDVHLIRVTAQPGIVGEPTPEGIHRDGAEFVTVHLAEIENAGGGEVTIYDPQEQPVYRLKLRDIMDSYYLCDTNVLHDVTPITSEDDRRRGVRSILTLDYHYKPDLERPVK